MRNPFLHVLGKKPDILFWVGSAGSYDDRVNTVRTFTINLGNFSQLSALQTQVQTYYDTLISAKKLDFTRRQSSNNTEGKNISIPLSDSGFYEKLKAYENEEIPYSRLETLDGTAITPYANEYETVTVYGQEIISTGNGAFALSDLTAPSVNFPVYLYESGKLNIKPSVIDLNVQASFIRKPQNVKWGFTLGTVGQYLYSSSNSINFQLSSSEQVEVITRILFYSGIIIRDPQIIQVAAQEIQQNEINQKS